MMNSSPMAGPSGLQRPPRMILSEISTSGNTSARLSIDVNQPFRIGFPAPLPPFNAPAQPAENYYSQVIVETFRSAVKLVLSCYRIPVAVVSIRRLNGQFSAVAGVSHSPHWMAALGTLFDWMMTEGFGPYPVQFWDVDKMCYERDHPVERSCPPAICWNRFGPAIEDVLPTAPWSTIRLVRRGFYVNPLLNPIKIIITSPSAKQLEKSRHKIFKVCKKYGYGALEVLFEDAKFLPVKLEDIQGSVFEHLKFDPQTFECTPEIPKRLFGNQLPTSYSSARL